MQVCPCEGCTDLGQVEGVLTQVLANLNITGEDDITVGRRILNDLNVLRVSMTMKHTSQQDSKSGSNGHVNGGSPTVSLHLLRIQFGTDADILQ